MTIMAPKNKWELSDMMKFAVAFDGPIAIRYPRGEAYCGLEEFRAPVELGKSELIKKGKKVLVLALGSMVKEGEEALELLEKDGISPTFVNARFAKPLDTELLKKASKDYKLVVTLEENVITGGFGQQVTQELLSNGFKGKILNIAVPDAFVEHGAPSKLFEMLEMDAKSIARRIKEQLD